MRRLTCLAVGAVVMVGATSASLADIAINLGNNTLTGGTFNTYTFNLNGTLTDFAFEVNYVDGSSASLASDMMIQILDPNGVGYHFGGFNVIPPGGSALAGLWSYNGFGSSGSGTYSDTSNPIPLGGLTGSGMWTIRVGNGWTGGGASQYNFSSFNMKGSIVPAPAGLAVLGLLGFGRRRRS